MANAAKAHQVSRDYRVVPGGRLDHLLNFTKAHPILTYLALAYAITWSAAALSWISIVFPLLGLFGPAVAAVTVAGCTDGLATVSDMFKRLFTVRVGWRWYVIVLGLPAAIVLVAAGLNNLVGTLTPSKLGSVTPLMLVIGVLVVGEELGWRGYALPQLMKTRSALTASILLGFVWAAWHIPNFLFLDESSAYGRSFLAYCLWVVPFSILVGWVFVNTRGSVMVATIFHAAANLAGPLFGSALDVQEAWVLEGTLMLALALGLTIALGPSLQQGSWRGARKARSTR